MPDVAVPFTQSEVDDAVAAIPGGLSQAEALDVIRDVMHDAAADQVWRWKVAARNQTENEGRSVEHAAHDALWNPAE